MEVAPESESDERADHILSFVLDLDVLNEHFPASNKLHVTFLLLRILSSGLWLRRGWVMI